MDQPPVIIPVTLSALEVRIAEHEIPVSFLPYSTREYQKLRAATDLFFVEEQRQLLVVPFDDDRSDLPAPRAMPAGPWLPLIADILERRLHVLADIDAEGDLVLPTIDLTKTAHERADVPRGDVLATIRRHPKVHLGARHLEREARREMLVLAMDLRTMVTCVGTVADLLARGLDIAGLGIAELPYASGGPRLAGIARDVEDGVVVVTTKTGIARLNPSRCGLFPSLATLETLRERVYEPDVRERLVAAERDVEAELLGSGQLQLLREVARRFREHGAVRIARGITISCGELVTLDAQHNVEVTYRIGGDREAAAPPIAALAKHGPVDGLATKLPRFVVLSPRSLEGEVTSFCDQLLHGRETSPNALCRVGFVDAFRVHGARFDVLPVDVPKHAIASAYVRAIEEAIASEGPPALVLVAVDDSHGIDELDDPYLASVIGLLPRGVPAIQLRRSKITGPECDRTTEELSLAIYAALGGQPWLLPNADPDARLFGIGNAITGRGANRSVRAIATAFTGDGRFIGARCSASHKLDAFGDALRGVVHDIATRELAPRPTFHLWPMPHGWNAGDVVRIIEELTDPPHASYVVVRRDHTFTIFADNGNVPARGSVLPLDASARLVAVHGPVQRHERVAMPKPLLLELHERSTSQNLDEVATQLFRLTGMHGGPIHELREPVTLYYARLIAKLLGRLERHPGWSDELLCGALWARPWFL